jgi:hypothetical protein
MWAGLVRQHGGSCGGVPNDGTGERQGRGRCAARAGEQRATRLAAGASAGVAARHRSAGRPELRRAARALARAGGAGAWCRRTERWGGAGSACAGGALARRRWTRLGWCGLGADDSGCGRTVLAQIAGKRQLRRKQARERRRWAGGRHRSAWGGMEHRRLQAARMSGQAQDWSGSRAVQERNVGSAEQVARVCAWWRTGVGVWVGVGRPEQSGPMGTSRQSWSATCRATARAGGVAVESCCARCKNAMAVSRTQLRCSTKCRCARC